MRPTSCPPPEQMDALFIGPTGPRLFARDHPARPALAAESLPRLRRAESQERRAWAQEQPDD